MNEDNKYTQFDPHHLSPNLRSFILGRDKARKIRSRRILELLEQAATDLQVAKLFYHDPARQSAENVRHWLERCATRALGALLWSTIGINPGAKCSREYRAALTAAGSNVSELPNPPWEADCIDHAEQLQRLTAATLLLRLIREQIETKAGDRL